MSFIYGKHGHNCHEVVTISGAFAPQGLNTAPEKVSGLGYTVAYAGVGLYTVTFTDKTLTKCIAGQCSVGATSPTDKGVAFKTTSGAIYDSTNRQITIQAITSNTGAALELDASSGGGNDGSVICFTLHFSKSSLPAV